MCTDIYITIFLPQEQHSSAADYAAIINLAINTSKQGPFTLLP